MRLRNTKLPCTLAYIMFAFTHLPVKDVEPVLTAVCRYNVMSLFLKTSCMMKQENKKLLREEAWTREHFMFLELIRNKLKNSSLSKSTRSQVSERDLSG